MKALDNYERLTARFAITMATLICVLFLAAAAASAKTITVTSTGDTIAVDGVVTLREAITAANTNAPSGDAPAGDPGMDVINFNILGGGVRTISPTSALPAITEPITINGYTQPGASANTLAVGSDAILLIELDGTNAGASTSGLTITAGNSTFRGLVINRFAFLGIDLQTNGGNTIAGNFIGTNASGTAGFPIPNNNVGVYVKSANNIIGGVLPADRNVVSGNGTASGGRGIWLDTAIATGNKVIGNYIGTGASGATKVGNSGDGVSIGGSSFNIIGGSTSAERNVISGNGSGNGITIIGNATNNQIMGNFIGTKADGLSPLGNAQLGIYISSGPTNNVIGGTASGAGNVIAFNPTSGINLFGAQSINNAILGNSIYSSQSGIGIDLFSGASGVTPNDNNTGDADTGPNNLQNFPVIISAISSGGTTTIKGTLDSAFSTQFRLEFFSNTAPNSSGFGEGQTFLGFANVVTDASGKASFTFNVPSANVVGGFFSATATDPNGNTSEFAACASGVVSSPGTLQLSTNSQLKLENAGSFTINVTRTNGSTGTVTVHYATADGTAKAPSDYTATSGTLTFNDGETSKPLSIPIIDDNTPEGSEGFTLTLSNPTGGAVLGSVATATLIIQDNEDPTLSINNVSLPEGNSGTTNATFTVTLSDPITNTVTVDFGTVAGGTATLGNDYQPASGTLTFAPGQTSKQISVVVSGDTTQEPDETFFVNLSNASNATISKAQGVGTIINDDGVAQPTLQFSSATYNVQEALGALTVTVTRSGDTSGSASVNYASSDGTATQHGDYEIAMGTINFAPGDTTKTFQVLINEDNYVEGNEQFGLSLSNATGASIGQPGTASVTISDDLPESLTNPIDDAQSFVYQQYHDFLNREPDPPGLAGWTNTLLNCAPGDISCDRIHVSASFFQSAEFQQRGYFLYRFYSVGLGRKPDYSEFAADMSRLSGFLDANQLEAAKVQFITDFMARPAYVAKYNALNNAAFVQMEMQTAGVNLPNSGALITSLDMQQATRAQVLRQIVESNEVYQKYYNQAFVVMQYFGYLRRDPDALYVNWITALDQNSDPRGMVNGFMNSLEYRQRFGL